MKIVVASLSPLKLDACKAAFGSHARFADAEYLAVKAASNVNEQPVDEETLTGAFNRIRHARALAPGANYYVAIESGIFNEFGVYNDIPVVALGTLTFEPMITYGERVRFPDEAVGIARARGFDQWTVGRVMQEMGIVRQHDDPHLDLTGKSREAYLRETVKRAVDSLGLPAPRA